MFPLIIAPLSAFTRTDEIERSYCDVVTCKIFHAMSKFHVPLVCHKMSDPQCLTRVLFTPTPPPRPVVHQQITVGPVHIPHTGYIFQGRFVPSKFQNSVQPVLSFHLHRTQIYLLSNRISETCSACFASIWSTECASNFASSWRHRPKVVSSFEKHKQWRKVTVKQTIKLTDWSTNVFESQNCYCFDRTYFCHKTDCAFA